MARGCNRKPRVSWGAPCWEAKLACERWAGPGGIRGKVQSRESVQCDKCDKLRAPPAGPGLWLAGSLQDSGSGHVEARGSSERRGAAGAVGGSALPAEGEAVRTWSTHRRIGPLMGCLLLEVGEQWLVTFLLGLREASQERVAHSLRSPSSTGPFRAALLTRVLQASHADLQWLGVACRLLAGGTVAHILSALPLVGGWLCSQTSWRAAPGKGASVGVPTCGQDLQAAGGLELLRLVEQVQGQFQGVKLLARVSRRRCWASARLARHCDGEGNPGSGPPAPSPQGAVQGQA